MTTDELMLDALKSGAIYTNPESGEVYSRRWPHALGTLNQKGYKVATLHYAGFRRQIKLHRCIWIAAQGIPVGGLVIDHINGRKADNRLVNLRLADARLNSRNRRSYEGSNNPASILTDAQVQAIRNKSQDGVSYSLLARRFKVSKSTVAAIVRRETW